MVYSDWAGFYDARLNPILCLNVNHLINSNTECRMVKYKVIETKLYLLILPIL